MSRNRIVYMDTIKVFLTCLVVAHHAGQAYGPTGGMWPVTESPGATWLGSFFFINASYMMGLYFFISGYFMVFSLTRKTTATFIKDRLTRLGIPLLFFIFLVFLPFNYLGAGQQGSVLRFLWDSYWNNPPAATGHLWFVASLLAYTFIYLLLFGAKSGESRLANVRFRSYYIFIYILLLVLLTAWVRMKYPVDNWQTWLIPVEPAHLPQYLSLFLAGALFNRFQWLDALKLSSGLLFLAMAIAVFLLNNQLPPQVKTYWLTESLVECLLCMGISLFLLTAFRQYGNQTNALVRTLSDNAYGIYLFHVLIVIGLQKALLNLPVNVNIKMMVVTFAGIALSLGLSALVRKPALVRRVL